MLACSCTARTASVLGALAAAGEASIDCVAFGGLGAVWARRHPERTAAQVGSDVHRAARGFAPPQDVVDSSAEATAKYLRSLGADEDSSEHGNGTAAAPSSEYGPAVKAEPDAGEPSVPLSVALAVAHAAVLNGWHVGVFEADPSDIAGACMRAAVTGSGPLPAASPVPSGMAARIANLGRSLMPEQAGDHWGSSPGRVRPAADAAQAEQAVPRDSPPGQSGAKQAAAGCVPNQRRSSAAGGKHVLSLRNPRPVPASQQSSDDPDAPQQQQQQQRKRALKRKAASVDGCCQHLCAQWDTGRAPQRSVKLEIAIQNSPLVPSQLVQPPPPPVPVAEGAAPWAPIILD